MINLELLGSIFLAVTLFVVMSITGAISCKAKCLESKDKDNKMVVNIAEKIDKIKNMSKIVNTEQDIKYRLTGAILAFLMILG